MDRLHSSRKLLAVGAAALAACSAVAGCGSASLGTIANAAVTTSAAGPVRLAMTGTMGVTGQSITLTGSGVLDGKAHRGSIDLTMGGIPGGAFGGTLQMSAIYDGLVIYMRSPVFASLTPGGNQWLKLDLAAAGKVQGLNLSQFQSSYSDPTQLLDFLRATAGGGTRIATGVDIRGTSTTEYSAMIDLKTLLSRLPASERAATQQLITASAGGKLPIEVWIDAQGRVRRVHEHYALTSPGAANPGGQAAPSSTGALSLDVTYDLFDYGAVAPITPPPASDVIDVTQLAAHQLQSQGQTQGQGQTLTTP